jgi:hypothetical protein
MNAGYLKNGVDPTAQRAVMAHELAHHHQAVFGAAMDNGLRGALGEGLADAVAADMTGNWNPYDGLLADDDDERDLAADKLLTEYPQAEIHASGQIFGNMIYRIKNQPGVSAQARAKLILNTYDFLRPDYGGNPSQYDLIDVYDAMIDAAGTDTALKQAISNVWTQMAGPAGSGSGDSGSGGPSGGVPPPPSAPPAPAFVDGYKTSCSGSSVVYKTYWTPVFGATSYDVYYRFLGFPGSYLYEQTWFVTDVYSVASVDVEVKIKACNANGCSWLSVDSLVITNDC